jgi:Bestrophin, RFP-TM, chloride channel
MNSFKLLLLIASLGVPAAEGFFVGGQESKPVKADRLNYINGEELSLNGPSLVIPLSQAKHKRKQKTNFSSDYCNADGRRDFQYINNRHSSADWLHNLKTLHTSSVLREVRNPVMTLTAWATLISVVRHTLLARGNIQVAASMAVPMVAHSLLVSSLGLLLVFRTNSSYQRFLVSPCR